MLAFIGVVWRGVIVVQRVSIPFMIPVCLPAMLAAASYYYLILSFIINYFNRNRALPSLFHKAVLSFTHLTSPL